MRRGSSFCLLASCFFLTSFLLPAIAENKDSVWEKRRRDDPVLDQYNDDPWMNRSRDLLLALGVQAFYKKENSPPYFFFPEFNIEGAATRHFTVALNFNPTHLSIDLTKTVYLFLGSLNFYPWGKFDGLWIRGGAGAVVTSDSPNGNDNRLLLYPAGTGTVGWRFFIRDPQVLFSVGISAGAQIYLTPGSAGLLPTAQLEAGIFP